MFAWKFSNARAFFGKSGFWQKLTVLWWIAAQTAWSAPGNSSDYTDQRERMVQEQMILRDVHDKAVLDAMGAVPRHEFVPEEYQPDAYADEPLPIGFGQTISQPYIVALMTELLQLKGGEKVLDVGTGSGYQAAILTKFTPNVFTIEIIPELHRVALDRLKAYGLDAEHVVLGDGYYGVEKEAPFDAIVVTAAADHIPPPLIKQLRPGGRMVIPIGPVHSVQRLVLLEKDNEGKVHTRTVLPVAFVPLTGGPANTGE